MKKSLLFVLPLTLALSEADALAAPAKIKLGAINKNKAKTTEELTVSFSLLTASNRRDNSSVPVNLRLYQDSSCQTESSVSPSIISSTSKSKTFKIASGGNYYLKLESTGLTSSSCSGSVEIISAETVASKIGVSIQKSSNTEALIQLKSLASDDSLVLSDKKISVSLVESCPSGAKLKSSRVYSVSLKNGVANLKVSLSGERNVGLKASDETNSLGSVCLSPIPFGQGTSGQSLSNLNVDSNSGSGGGGGITPPPAPVACTASNSGIQNALSVSGNLGSCTLNECVSGYLPQNGQCLQSTTYYRDLDNDEFGDSNSSQQALSKPVGYVSNSSDCDDSRASVFPGAEETCANLGTNNDCDGINSEAEASDRSVFYLDSNSDGYADNQSSTVLACSLPSGYTANSSLAPVVASVSIDIPSVRAKQDRISSSSQAAQPLYNAGNPRQSINLRQGDQVSQAQTYNDYYIQNSPTHSGLYSGLFINDVNSISESQSKVYISGNCSLNGQAVLISMEDVTSQIQAASMGSSFYNNPISASQVTSTCIGGRYEGEISFSKNQNTESVVRIKSQLGSAEIYTDLIQVVSGGSYVGNNFGSQEYFSINSIGSDSLAFQGCLPGFSCTSGSGSGPSSDDVIISAGGTLSLTINRYSQGSQFGFPTYNLEPCRKDGKLELIDLLFVDGGFHSSIPDSIGVNALEEINLRSNQFSKSCQGSNCSSVERVASCNESGSSYSLSIDISNYNSDGDYSDSMTIFAFQRDIFGNDYRGYTNDSFGGGSFRAKDKKALYLNNNDTYDRVRFYVDKNLKKDLKVIKKVGGSTDESYSSVYGPYRSGNSSDYYPITVEARPLNGLGKSNPVSLVPPDNVEYFIFGFKNAGNIPRIYHLDTSCSLYSNCLYGEFNSFNNSYTGTSTVLSAAPYFGDPSDQNLMTTYGNLDNYKISSFGIDHTYNGFSYSIKPNLIVEDPYYYSFISGGNSPVPHNLEGEYSILMSTGQSFSGSKSGASLGKKSINIKMEVQDVCSSYYPNSLLKHETNQTGNPVSFCDCEQGYQNSGTSCELTSSPGGGGSGTGSVESLLSQYSCPGSFNAYIEYSFGGPVTSFCTGSSFSFPGQVASVLPPQSLGFSQACSDRFMGSYNYLFANAPSMSSGGYLIYESYNNGSFTRYYCSSSQF
jgi:hypothetical protein